MLYLGVYESVEKFSGKCIAIIHRINDESDKLVIAPENQNFTDSEIKSLTNFQEHYFESIIIRPDDYINWNKNIPEFSVTNLKESLDFYEIIGFKIKYERPENKFAFISMGDIQFMLQEIHCNDK